MKRMFIATFLNKKTQETREEEIVAVNMTQAATRGETIFIRCDEILIELVELD